MKARPHVLVVTGKLDRGGTELHLLQLLPRLRACELDIAVFALRAGGVLTAALRAAGVPVIEGTRWRGVLGVCATALHLLLVLLTRRPHIVHCFLPEAYVVGGLCTAWWPRLRRVMSRRSLNHYQARYPGIRLLERLLHRRMHAVLGNSAAVLTQLRAEGVDERRLLLIYNGIDVARRDRATDRVAARARLGIDQAALVGVTVANLIPYKGHADLLAALALARAALPAGSVWFCVGRDDGPGSALRAQAATCGVADLLRWVGEQDDVVDYLACADIGVLPSHEEGFSNAVLEGMAAGLPMVVTAVGGNAEAVVDGDCGLVVPARMPAALAAAMVALAGDPERRRTLGARAQARIRERFTLDACVARYAEFYRSLIRYP